MRAYKFLNAHFGLKTLYEKRIKISTIADLNDPFELIPFNLSDAKNRRRLQNARDEIGAHRGMLCFSAAWSDPVIWAHYADKHRGLCIGFEIATNKKVSKKVDYRSKRLPFPVTLSESQAVEFLFTKYDNWRYEREIRMWARLDDDEDGVYFYDFDDTLQVAEVIGGARCTLPRKAIMRALGPLRENVALTKARAAFTKYEMVPDLRGWR